MMPAVPISNTTPIIYRSLRAKDGSEVFHREYLVIQDRYFVTFKTMVILPSDLLRKAHE